MAIQREIWEAEIQENLYKENPHLNYARNVDEFVIGGSVVHIPNAGAKPVVVKNRTVFPAVAIRRTDNDITYALDVYSTDPTHITNAEQIEISYPKLQSVIRDHTETLNEAIGNEMIYVWAPSLTAQIIRTTGAVTPAHLPSAIGNRKLLLGADLKNARTKMNKQNISAKDRFALIDSDMYAQLEADATIVSRDGANGGELNMREGIVKRLYGFDIMERSTTVIYTNAAPPVKKATSAAAAATDNGAVLCWQKNSVERALGSIKFFETLNDATYYGDVYSAEVKFGGRISRTNEEGVVAIVQEP